MQKVEGASNSQEEGRKKKRRRVIYAQLMFFLDCPDIKLCVYAMRINDTAQYTALAIYYYRPSTDPFFLLSSMDVEFFFLSSRGGL